MEDNKINVWENDPSTGLEFNEGAIIEVDKPDIGTTSLSTSIDQPQPPAAKYEQGTDGFRYWNLAAALSRASSFWSSFLPDIQWQTGPVLNVIMDREEELQSEYSRLLKAIRFFHKKILNKIIYTCESPDLVCHEMGHAVLDAIKPELWHSAFKEVSAFHEAFGDISAILCGLQVPSLRSSVLAETNNKVYDSCRISRFAKQFGWGKRQTDATTVEPDCCRNAVNSFFYQDEAMLLPGGTVNQLTSDPYSFLRIFTGAFFESFANMFLLHRECSEAMLLQVSKDIAKIFINGIRAAIVTRNFFAEVATKMVHIANAMFPGIAYGQAVRSAFVRHGVLSLANASEFAMPMFPKDLNFDLLMENNSGELAKVIIPMYQYGFGVDKVVVQVSEQGRKGDVKIEAASATSYIESLIAKGKLKLDDVVDGNMNMKILRPNKLDEDFNYTHELKREGSEYVLERLKI